MISKKLQDAINDQINKELFSEYLYISMKSWCLSNDLEGFANWMDVQSKEERFHAMKFYNFINDRGGRIILKAIDAPQADFKSPEDVIDTGLKHEYTVTASINKIMDLAIAESDHAAASFLKWFIDEQVEEEANFTKVLNKVKLSGGAGAGLFMIDQELAKRVYTPPAGAAADTAA
ncbi:MAG: ferritin [Fibrobacteres bacterium]|nr:ferritin [Fibrobacterota bacterium]